MKAIYYDSYQRFTTRIIKQWQNNGFKYNSSHVGILFYAWRTKLYWSNVNRLKRSKINHININQLNLF